MLTRINRRLEERDEGFTLIELLVVIIIIGILAAIAIPVFLSQRKKGYDAAAKSDLRNLATLEETWLTDHSAYNADASTLPDYKRSNGVKVATRVSGDGQTFCLETYNTLSASPGLPANTPPATNVFVYDSSGGGAAASSCSLTDGTWTGWK